MKQLGFEYKVSIDLEFSKEEVDHLIALAESHYDGECQAAAQQCGFLNGIRNRLLFGDGKITSWSFDDHDLGTLGKITETEKDDFPLKDSLSLWLDVGRAQQAIIKEWERVVRESEKLASAS